MEKYSQVKIPAVFGDDGGTSDKLGEYIGVKKSRKFKDPFFTSIFREKGYAVLLYEALFPDEYICEAKDCILLLAEHQSTLNYNMPLRMLLYLAEEYKRFIYNDGSEKIYGKKP